MTIHQPSQSNNIDQQIIDEFVCEYNLSHDVIESLLLKLENTPQDSNLLHSLFREVHTIKGNAQLIGLHSISTFVHTLETTLDKVRKNELSFDKSLSDIILDAIDLIGELCKNPRHTNHKCTTQINAIIEKLDICTKPSTRAPVDPNDKLHDALMNQNKITEHVNTEKLEDLKFFSRIVCVTEQRATFWEGRSQRILNIALELNSQAGQLVDSAQLEAAVYLHDIGMAFLPLDIINQNRFLSEREHQIIKAHPNIGATMLDGNPIWKEAAIIIMQHHESEDGKGYPMGLRSNQICNGAKILSIADTFESLTNQRENSTLRYPVTQAIADINSKSGTQFSEFWVSIFNDIIRKKTSKL